MTDQPRQSAFSSRTGPVDDITTIMGRLPPEEYALRARLRSSRIMAHAALRQSTGQMTRAVAWDVINLVTANIYEPADLAWLEDVAEACRRLLLAGLALEKLEAPDEIL